MKKIQPILDTLITEIGEETVAAELEGILRKHRGIRKRRRKQGAVAECAEMIKRERPQGRENHTRLAARTACSRNLSQASVYRMVALLHQADIPVKAAQVIREMERIKKSVY